MRVAAVSGFASLLLLGAAPAPADGPTEASLRAADAETLRIIVQGDARAQQEFMHPNYIINGPANRVLRKDEVVTMLARGDIASERFERTIEDTAITGSVGIVMGNETVTPSAASELGRLHPGQTLRRRFTNVFLWENGRWRFLARHASIVNSPAPMQRHPNPHPHATACEPANGREGQPGCWVVATARVPATGGPFYWHVYELSPGERAQRLPDGAALMRAHGRFWLVAVGEQDWRSRQGRHVASVGPLHLLSSGPHTASLMEATFTPGMASRVHTHPGPEAWVVLEGEQCLETPEGLIRGGAGEAMAVRGGIPMALFGTGAAVRKALVLILHPAGDPLGTPHHEWQPTGACLST